MGRIISESSKREVKSGLTLLPYTNEKVLSPSEEREEYRDIPSPMPAYSEKLSLVPAEPYDDHRSPSTSLELSMKSKVGPVAPATSSFINKSMNEVLPNVQISVQICGHEVLDSP
jgi:hypothetical protein